MGGWGGEFVNRAQTRGPEKVFPRNRPRIKEGRHFTNRLRTRRLRKVPPLTPQNTRTAGSRKSHRGAALRKSAARWIVTGRPSDSGREGRGSSPKNAPRPFRGADPLPSPLKSARWLRWRRVLLKPALEGH